VIAVTADLFGKECNVFGVVLLFQINEDCVLGTQVVLPIAEVCAQIKKSGYAASQNVRMYGEEFEVLSDPFPNEIGIAVRVRSLCTSQIRHSQLPAALIHRVSEHPRLS